MQTITGTRDQARAFLAEHGADADDAAGVLAAAEQFPGSWAYTGNRWSAVVYQVPAGTYQAADTRESEERIARLRRPRQFLRIAARLES
jgi:hypothetical protein